MIQKIFKILDRFSRWQNVIDERDIQSIYSFDTDDEGIRVVTETLGAGAYQNILRDPTYFNQEVLSNVGFFIDVTIGGYCNAANGIIHISNGRDRMGVQLPVAALAVMAANTYPVYSPVMDIDLYGGTTGFTFHCWFCLRVLMKEQYNPQIIGQNMPFGSPPSKPLEKPIKKA